LGVIAWRHRHKVALIAHVNSGNMAMHNLQAGIVRGEPAHDLFPLFSIQRAILQTFEGGLFTLCHNVDLSLPGLDQALGSIRDHYTNSPAGSGRLLPGMPATKQWIAATEVRLLNGHKAPK
jgi:hypothetical protein